MLTIIAKRRAEKSKKRAQELVAEGLKKVVSKLYKQAMLCFGEAIELDQEAVLPILKEQFAKFYRVSDYDSALSCGMAAFKICKTDPALANQLGNCARRHENYKRANNMYRFALKIDRNYKEAFFNLAASMGKVNLFDLNVGIKIKEHLSVDDFILPEYLDNPNFIEQIIDQLIIDFEKEREFREDSVFFDLSEEIESGSEDSNGKGDFTAVEKETYQPSAESIIEYIKKELVDCSKEGISPDPVYYLKLRYNMGIYCLAVDQLEEATSCVQEIIKSSPKYEYTEMLHAIIEYKKGRKNKAIEAFIHLLGKDRYNRFYNANLGMIYKQEKNRLLATKYLAVAAFLLDKSGGLYKTSEIMQLATQAFEEGDLKKAYRLYSIVTSESDNIEAILKIGDIFFTKKNFKRASEQYYYALKIEPTSKDAVERIELAFQFFYKDAQALYKENKFANAVDGFEKALIFKTEINSLKAVFDIYTHLKKIDKARIYEKQYLALLEEEKEKKLEVEKQEFIKKGKVYLKAKCFHDAIDAFEEAFRRKPDKDIFMYLAHLYKSLRKKAELENLLSRWNRKREMEERLKIEQKIQENQKKAQSLYS